MQINTKVRCIACFNCLYLVLGFSIVWDSYSTGTFESARFYFWAPIMSLNILSNFLLLISVRKSIIMTWFPSTALILLITFTMPLNTIILIVNVYLIYTVAFLSKVYRNLRNTTNQRRCQTKNAEPKIKMELLKSDRDSSMSYLNKPIETNCDKTNCQKIEETTVTGMENTSLEEIHESAD